MRAFLVLVSLALLALPIAAQKNCKKGIPCGGTCIAANKTCHVGTRAPASRPAFNAALLTDSIQWIGWREAKLYFRARCIPASAVPLTERVYFRTEGQAKDSGFKRSKGDMDCPGRQ